MSHLGSAKYKVHPELYSHESAFYVELVCRARRVVAFDATTTRTGWTISVFRLGMTPTDPSQRGSARVHAATYDPDGSPAASWHSVATAQQRPEMGTALRKSKHAQVELLLPPWKTRWSSWATTARTGRAPVLSAHNDKVHDDADPRQNRRSVRGDPSGPHRGAGHEVA